MPFVEDGPRTMVIQKCARAGFTKCIVAVAAYGVLKSHNILAVLPRIRDSIGFRDDALAPTLSEIYGDIAHFGGCTWSKSELQLRPRAYSPVQSIKILYGNSADLRRVQASIACADELDAFDADIGGDGALFERLNSRLRESRGRLLAGSTPTRKGSVLDMAMRGEVTDLVFDWCWRCPSCDHWQDFDFERLNETRLACAECGEAHSEGDIRKTDQRWQALKDGRYISADGQSLNEGAWPYAVAFRINALAVPSLAWADLLQAERKARTPESMKVVKNEVHGVFFGASGRSVSLEELLESRETGLASDPARLRVMGVDVQKDRIEAVCVEYDTDTEHAYVLDYQAVEGDTDIAGRGAWQSLGELANQWRVHGGLLDSGFRTEAAYAWAKARYGWRCCKGLAKPLPNGGLYRVSRQRDRQADLVTISVGEVKHLLYDRLSDERQRWFHFSERLGEPFFQWPLIRGITDC